jgi:Na+/melibiose symporter-like transporter
MGETVRNWNLCVALVASLVAGLSYGLYGGLALYLDTFLWGLKASAVGVLNLANLFSVFFSAILATWLSRAVGKKHAAVIMFFGCVVAIQAPILLRLLGLAPPNGSPSLLPMLIAFRFAAGVLTNGGFIMMTSMIADITEEVQLKTGRRAEGFLMSAYSFITKATTGVSTLLPALVLALAHFPAKAHPGAVDPSIVRHMAWLYVPITSTLSFVSITTWMLYRIDQKKHEANLAGVREAQARADAAAEAQGEGAGTSLRAVG